MITIEPDSFEDIIELTSFLSSYEDEIFEFIEHAAHPCIIDIFNDRALKHHSS